jgi:hypothetical protein
MVSLIGQAGQSEAIHSPDEYARTVVRFEIALQSPEPETAKADSSVRPSSHGTPLHRRYSRKGSEVIQYSLRRRASSIPR